MISIKKKARFAGVLLLVLIITGVFAEFFVRQKIFVPNNVATTADNIINKEFLFRIGFVADLIMATVYFMFAFKLYVIFKTVNKSLALFMLLCVVISVAMYCQNMLYHFSALELLSNQDYSEAFKKEQLQSLSTFFVKIHGYGYFVNQIFYGLYLLPLGYMIYTSGLIAKIIGVFLMLGCIGDLISFVDYFLFPNHESILINNITLPADIGEFSLCLWLLIVGVRDFKSPRVTIKAQLIKY